MKRRSQAAAGVALGLVVVAAASAAPATDLSFEVRLDDRPIGVHRFELRREGAVREVLSQADFRVRLLFVDIYRYRHVATERWRDGCLESLEARTDDNGQIETVAARRSGEGLAVAATGASEWHHGCVRSFAYWNPSILGASHLLNSQTGDYVAVRVQALGEERVAARGGMESARRYRIVGEGIEIDLWYGREQEWLALESRTPDGRRLRYERS